MTRHYPLIAAAEADQTVHDCENNVVDIATHRTASDNRFPRVDDIVDRLTMDMQSMVQTFGGTDISI